MPLATFAPPTRAVQTPTLNRTQAASRLGINNPAFDKMIRAGMLFPPYRADKIVELSKREQLRVKSGELTVLRADARAESDPVLYPGEDRRWIGFHVEHTDEELEAASLRWWQCRPARVIDNELLVVTIATFPVALYRITGQRGEPLYRPGEAKPRHGFTGQLLARVTHGMEVVRYREITPGHLENPVKQVMGSRVVVTSGGPIGYLEPDHQAEHISTMS